jgi:hypothetical protein
MEICIECGKPCDTGSVRTIGIGNEDRGAMHSACVDKILVDHIAIRESDKPKAPTLEERVAIMLTGEVQTWQPGAFPETIAERIIAMVREYDWTTDWKDRAEKAEGKLAAIRSELST